MYEILKDICFNNALIGDQRKIQTIEFLELAHTSSELNPHPPKAVCKRQDDMAVFSNKIM